MDSEKSLHEADGFHLQEDVAKPMIFVSAGTGFAALFNGIRSTSVDYLYRDEIGHFTTAALICQFTQITHTHIGR